MTRRRLIVACAVLIASSACGARDSGPPELLGIRFGAPTDAFRQFLPDNAVRESYPLIPAFGYKLNFPNPDGWSVIVQDSSQDMTRNQVYGIYISRTRADSCTQSAADSLMRTLRKHQLAGFDQVVTRQVEGSIGVSAVGLGRRRVLTVMVSCFIRTLAADMSYVDRDLFSYRDTLKADSLILQISEAMKGYESRTLKD